MLLALLPSTLFKIDKSAAFSVLSTGTLCLLPISILGASAGTIRAVPDTVKKVPGLAPVLFYEHWDLSELVFVTSKCSVFQNGSSLRNSIKFIIRTGASPGTFSSVSGTARMVPAEDQQMLLIVRKLV